MASEQRTPDVHNVPDQDGRDRNVRKDRRPVPGAGGEPRGVEPHIADADKAVRTGSTKETVRDTPPFGDYYEQPFVEKNKPSRDAAAADEHKDEDH
jgi:hypothetical protein